MANEDEKEVRFLIASDTHAGYGETKKQIHNDSFDSFREVLEHGSTNNVDFVLLAGDLFHENNPSRETQLKVVRLLRHYCLKDGELEIQFLSDPTVNFDHSDFPTVNYEDDNLNIGMPIFTIHGNHDDLSGKGLTALDVLHETGLVNLFGKYSNVDHIEAAPILLKKGSTKIAIYGIGSQRDDRLCRAFMQGSIKFLRPNDDPDSWFSILVVHQNRPRRGSARNSYLPMSFIPPFFDLVLWGHEHECLIEPQYFKIAENGPEEDGFYVIQPGSSVATSLCREETVQKHCAIITVKGRHFKCDPIPLQTTRQILVDELVLEDELPDIILEKSTVRQKNMKDENLIMKTIDKMLTDAASSRKESQPYPPLMHLVVVYSGQWLNIPPINGRRFGAANYMDKVANPNEMIVVRSVRGEKPEDNEPLNAIIGEKIAEITSVDEMVEKYFINCAPRDRLSILSEVDMCRSLKEYSDEEATLSAIDKSFAEQVKSQIASFGEQIQGLVTAAVGECEENISQGDITNKINECVKEAKRNRLDDDSTDATMEAPTYDGAREEDFMSD